MFRTISLRGAAAVLSLLAATACGSTPGGSSSSGGSANPAAPSAPALNLAGSWSGKLIFMNSDGTPDTSNPGSAAWTATQSGSSLIGPLKLTVTDNGQTETYQGILTGALSEAQLSLTLSFLPGTFVDAPTCVITGTGTAPASSSAITSNLSINFGAGCIGTVSDRPTETDQLQLTRQ